MSKSFLAIIEKDKASGTYIGYIPELRGAHTQGDTLQELRENLKEVIELVLEEDPFNKDYAESDFVGTEQVMV